MSWHYSQALVAEYLVANSSAGGQFALSKTTSTHGMCWSPGKTTDASPRSRSGMTYAPLTDDHGAELLMWFLAGFPARHLARQPGDEIRRERCGRKCCALWGTSVRSLFSPKTSARMLSLTLKQTLPVVDIGPPEPACQRNTWAQTILGEDGGLLATPTTKANWAAKSMQKWPSSRRSVMVFGRPTPEIHEWLMGWPLGYTSTEPMKKGYFYDREQRAQGRAAGICSDEMRSVWWDNDPSTTPYQPRSTRQQAGEHQDSLPGMSQKYAHERRNVGEGGNSGVKMRNMRGGISAKEAEEICAMRENRMFAREGEIVSRLAVGVKNKVDRLRCIGNGQVPLVAATAWKILTTAERTKP